MNTQIYLSVHIMVCRRLLNVCTYLQTTVNSRCISLLSENTSRGQGLGAPTPSMKLHIARAHSQGSAAQCISIDTILVSHTLAFQLRRGLRSGDTVLERVCWRLQLREAIVHSGKFLYQLFCSSFCLPPAPLSCI